MDIPTSWNWFNEVFYPEGRRKTCHLVLLLMDNAQGNFEGSMLNVHELNWENFQRENVVVRCFTLNVTSWKRPCNLGVAAAVKKINKFSSAEP